MSPTLPKLNQYKYQCKDFENHNVQKNAWFLYDVHLSLAFPLFCK